MTCLNTLCSGGGDNTKCNYCYRRAKLRPHNQCGQTCRDGSRVNCLMCCCRANFEYDLEDHGDSPGPCHMENSHK